MWFEIFAQSVGVLAMIAFASSYQMKTQRNIVVFQLAGGMIFAIHYLMLGSLTGCYLNLVGAARCLVYSQRGKAWANSIAWVFFFVIAGFVIALLTYQTYWDFLPATALGLACVSLYLTNVKVIRVLSLVISPMWLTYAIVQRSLGSFLNEIFSLTSVIIAIIRLDIRKKPASRIIETGENIALDC